jgi:NAD(P)-dependent dehydrogenase (short-subunit alcohol dehydrogenase family)
MGLRGLEGKVVVVAGGATDGGRRTADEITEAGGTATSVVFDLAGGVDIVNMSSAAAFQGEPTRPAYATAKAGVGALTRHVASRWGREGIRCNAVAPGFTATEAIRSVSQFAELEASALRRIRGNPGRSHR